MDILLWVASTFLSLGLSFIVSVYFLDVFLRWDYESPGERIWFSLTIWGLLMSVLTIVFMGITQFFIFKV